MNVSHYAYGRPVIGINSDPETSQGELLYFHTDGFIDKFLQAGKNPHFLTEEWSRIEGELRHPDGKHLSISPCISEISIRNETPENMSRYLVRTPDMEWEEHKCSGLLLASGAGSTGWFRNCYPDSLQEEAVFPKDASFFRMLARELALRSEQDYAFRRHTIGSEGCLEVISKMNGVVVVDSHTQNLPFQGQMSLYPFPAGTTARFAVSQSKLIVAYDMETQG